MRYTYIGSGSFGDIFRQDTGQVVKFAWYGDDDHDDPCSGPNVEVEMQAQASQISSHVLPVRWKKTTTQELHDCLQSCEKGTEIWVCRGNAFEGSRSVHCGDRLQRRRDPSLVLSFESESGHAERLLDICARNPDKTLLRMEMPYMDSGTLASKICQLSAPQTQRIIFQVLVALAQLQRNLSNFRHNDMHHFNVMLCTARQALAVRCPCNYDYCVGRRKYSVALGPDTLVPIIMDFGLAVDDLHMNYSVRSRDNELVNKPNDTRPCAIYDMFVFCDEYRSALAHHLKSSTGLWREIQEFLRGVTPRQLRGSPSRACGLSAQRAVRNHKGVAGRIDGRSVPLHVMTPEHLIQVSSLFEKFRR